MVVVWNTSNVGKGGQVTVLAKAHTDVDIITMKVAFFDETRYPLLCSHTCVFVLFRQHYILGNMFCACVQTSAANI